MLRFISKLNDELKDQLFILCSATSRYLATITAQLMLQNVVPNSFVTPEGRISRLMEAGRIHFLKLFRQKFDNRRANQNLSAAAACRIYRRRRRTGGGAHVCSRYYHGMYSKSVNLSGSHQPRQLLVSILTPMITQTKVQWILTRLVYPLLSPAHI